MKRRMRKEREKLARPVYFKRSFRGFNEAQVLAYLEEVRDAFEKECKRYEQIIQAQAFELELLRGARQADGPADLMVNRILSETRAAR